MKIAQIAPLVERVPPKKYGGTERVVSALTDELVRRGHDVTLFATGDSITKAKLVSVYPRSMREMKIDKPFSRNNFSLLNIGTAYQRQEEFDIIHDHNGVLSLPTANLSTTPVVMTQHGAFSRENRPLFQTFKNPYQVTISKSQAFAIPSMNHAGTIYNGLNLQDYPFSNEHDGYLLFVGRISMQKGVHYAVEAAMTLNLPLIIAAKLEPTDRPYYEEYIAPYLSEQIKWIGEVDEEERNKLMSRAMCFLHPVTWREPFGLTLIEAMACGSPIVAFNRGSIPEVIKNGKTGFVVEDIDGMLDAIENIAMINRENCRELTLEKFNTSNMTDRYEAVYKQIINKEI